MRSIHAVLPTLYAEMYTRGRAALHALRRRQPRRLRPRPADDRPGGRPPLVNLGDYTFKEATEAARLALLNGTHLDWYEFFDFELKPVNLVQAEEKTRWTHPGGWPRNLARRRDPGSCVVGPPPTVEAALPPWENQPDGRYHSCSPRNEEVTR